MADRHSVIIITGPTGVGKSDFAEKLAEKMPAEIINADMGQLYTPLSIGTAKPDWRHSVIKHHLFDVLDKPVSYSAAQYRNALLDTVQQVQSRGNIPLIVGGSSYYINAIFFPPQFSGDLVSHITPLPNKEIHWNALQAVDPERAQAIHPNDLYRIRRALEIWHTTQLKPSLYVPQYQKPWPFLFFFCTRERAQLYERINKRVHVMINQGWIEEVALLLQTDWKDFLERKKIIGYDDIIRYLMNQETLDQIIDIIAKKTRNYAKRQLTFWRMFEKKLHNMLALEQDKYSKIITLDLTFLDVDLYIKQLLESFDYI